MSNLLQRFTADRRGNVAIIAAGCMMLVIGCAALGVDLGSIFADRRKTQSAADLAAIVAASNLPQAEAAARATVTGNATGGGAESSNAAPTRRRRAFAGLALRDPASGGQPARDDRDADPLFFSGLFHRLDHTDTATATARQRGRLLRHGRGCVARRRAAATPCRQHLGTTTWLSAMDYQALAPPKWTRWFFSPALAKRTPPNAAPKASARRSVGRDVAAPGTRNRGQRLNALRPARCSSVAALTASPPNAPAR